MSNYFETVVDRLAPKDDLDWINFIYQYLIEFYNVNKEGVRFKDKNENTITKYPCGTVQGGNRSSTGRF
ncbi:MAG: hypothetical protein WCP85_29005 [Mariniphaga sp.]